MRGWAVERRCFANVPEEGSAGFILHDLHGGDRLSEVWSAGQGARPGTDRDPGG